MRKERAKRSGAVFTIVENLINRMDFFVFKLRSTYPVLTPVFFIRESWMANAAELAGGTWTTLQQLGVQVAAVLIAIAYAATVTIILLFILNKTMGVRSSTQSEMQGLDASYHGESGYGMVNPS